MGSLSEILTLVADEGDDSNKEDKVQSEVTKQEQESLIEKATEECEKKLKVEKSETSVEEALVSSTEQTLPEVEKSKIPVEEPPKLPEVEKSETPVEEAPVSSSEKKIDIEAAAGAAEKKNEAQLGMPKCDR
ncbi:hypothetical protein AAG906_025296 [Vitis piasezkii]